MSDLTVVDVGSVDALVKAGVAPDQIRYVNETEWALATPAPPLATTGAVTCLVVVVHHRTAGRGALAHVTTTNGHTQQQLFDSARKTVAELAAKVVQGTAYDKDSSPPLDLFLGGGKEFHPGEVSSKARTALPADHQDLPDWVTWQLTFDYEFHVTDRRLTPGVLPPPKGPNHDTGYVVYDAASGQVLVIDRRDEGLMALMREIQEKRKVSADPSGLDKTWGKHP